MHFLQIKVKAEWNKALSLLWPQLCLWELLVFQPCCRLLKAMTHVSILVTTAADTTPCYHPDDCDCVTSCLWICSLMQSGWLPTSSANLPVWSSHGFPGKEVTICFCDHDEYSLGLAAKSFDIFRYTFKYKLSSNQCMVLYVMFMVGFGFSIHAQESTKRNKTNLQNMKKTLESPAIYLYSH